MAVVPSLWVGNMGGKNGRTTDNADVVWAGAFAVPDIQRGADDVPVMALPPTPTPEPTPAPTEPPVLPSVREEPAPELTGAEAIVCEVFGDYCYDALAVAYCESGPDLWAGVGIHAGTFQLSVRYHAGKFAAHGWDIWADGSDYYRNSVVAFEIFAGRGYSWLGTSGWPVCGWRAGY